MSILEYHNRLQMVEYYKNKSAKHYCLMALCGMFLGCFILLPIFWFNFATLSLGIIFGVISFSGFIWNWLMGADAAYDAEHYMKYGW